MNKFDFRNILSYKFLINQIKDEANMANIDNLSYPITLIFCLQYTITITLNFIK